MASGIPGFFCLKANASGESSRISGLINLGEPWVVSENLQLKIVSAGGSVKSLTTGHKDYKPSWSKDGKRIIFFRLHSTGWLGFLDLKSLRTTICVINSDGTGFRELTSGKYPDFNPTWTRDGSNRIIFNRYSTKGGWLNRVYWTSPAASPGEEQLISDPLYPDCEWATGALKDGRIFVDRISAGAIKSFLLTPNPGKAGLYEEVSRPTTMLWHKLSISPDETKVAYMLDHDNNTMTFKDAVICYAHFDVKSLRIFDQIPITEENSRFIHEYPSWNSSGTLILYDSNLSGKYQIYAYSLDDRTTKRISGRADLNYQFVSVEGVPR